MNNNLRNLLVCTLAFTTSACSVCDRQKTVNLGLRNGVIVDKANVNLADAEENLAYISRETYLKEATELTQTLKEQKDRPEVQRYLALLNLVRTVPYDVEQCKLLATFFDLTIRPSAQNKHVSMSDAILKGACDQLTFANLMLYSAKRACVDAHNTSVIIAKAKDPDRVSPPLGFAFSIVAEKDVFVFESVQAAFAKGNDFNARGAKLTDDCATQILDHAASGGFFMLDGYLNTNTKTSLRPERYIVSSYSQDASVVYPENTKGEDIKTTVAGNCNGVELVMSIMTPQRRCQFIKLCFPNAIMEPFGEEKAEILAPRKHGYYLNHRHNRYHHYRRKHHHHRR